MAGELEPIRKPTIRKQGGQWVLQCTIHHRTFVSFGGGPRWYTATHHGLSWEGCVQTLRAAYRANQIVQQGRYA